MNADSTMLYDAALKLSETERADLAYRLLQTLHAPGVLSESDPDFLAVLQRRAEEYRKDPSSASPWEDVAERIRNTLQRRESK